MFSVVSDELRAHAATIERINEDEADVLAASDHATLGEHAYGQMCAIMPALLRPLQDGLRRAASQTVATLSATAQALRTAADDYDAKDAAAAQQLTRVHDTPPMTR